jgi:uncharacterized protein RhaS with RHS repeats
VQSDPIGLQGGLNPYSYANVNSLSFADPMGLEVEICDQTFSRPVTFGGITTTVTLTHQFLCLGGICRGFGPDDSAWRDDTSARGLAETTCRKVLTPTFCFGTGKPFDVQKFEACVDSSTQVGSTTGKPYSILSNNCQQAANRVLYACTAFACR